MHNILRVHVINGFTNTLEDALDHALILEPIFTDIVKQGSILGILENNIGALLFLIEMIVQHLNDVRVV